MKVKIAGHTSPMSIAQMWYAGHVGEVFEVEEDQVYENVYRTKDPIFEEHKGHIYKVDCEIIAESEVSA